MAKKKRSRRRRELLHDISPPTTTNTVSSNDSRLSHSARQSSDDLLSDSTTASDSTNTAVTSVMNTDECETDDTAATGDEEVGEQSEPHEAHSHARGTAETTSIYPRSRYPPVPNTFLVETPFLGSPEADMGASTRSLWAEELDYREVHGRRYCQEYHQPIDEMELMRQALIHQVFLHVLGGEPTTVPLEDPRYILDVGTGPGDWAIKLAEMFPRCEVVGTDIAAVAETSSVPMNVFFEIEDAEEWDRPPDMYDLVHFRCMDGAFRDWDYIYDNVFDSLKPGGWIEVQDMDSSKGLDLFAQIFPPESAIRTVLRDIVVAAEKAGRSMGIKHLDPQRLLDAGFTHVSVKDYGIPITVAQKTAGKIWLISCLDAFEALGLRLLTEQLGWDPDECKVVCEQAARELANMAKDPQRSEELIVNMRVMTARKPLNAPLAPSSSSPSSDDDDDEEDDGTSTPMEGVARENREALERATQLLSQSAQVDSPEAGAGVGIPVRGARTSPEPESDE